jgi:hypothetical protein
MTPARPQRKLSARSLCFQAVLAVPVLLACLSMAAIRSAASTTERIVVDRLTGLALSGFDPVAYFTEGRPMLGRGEIELALAGAVWRFHNEGNRAAFAADPQVYLPRFGGYDPTAIARGVSVPGHPEIHLIVRQRLYLFSSRQARDAFRAQPDTALSVAERKWPDVQRELPL